MTQHTVFLGKYSLYTTKKICRLQLVRCGMLCISVMSSLFLCTTYHFCLLLFSERLLRCPKMIVDLSVSLCRFYHFVFYYIVWICYRCLQIKNFCFYLVNQAFYHHEMSLFTSSNAFRLVVYFSVKTDNTNSQLLSVCMVYLLLLTIFYRLPVSCK